MKVFYGVQGTGNGHITRARVMAKQLIDAGIEVDFMFTGRPVDKFFDMDIFGKYQIKKGLTFEVYNGRIQYIDTIMNLSIKQCISDIKNLELSQYDTIISDYEPITSWAAKIQNLPVIGVGHQYAFNYDIPRQGFNPITSLIMKQYAPVTSSFGVHWHHFNQPILPPIIDNHITSSCIIDNKIVVYLPFENQQKVIRILSLFKEFDFHVYSSEKITSPYEHIHYYLPSRDGFQEQVRSCSGIICNAGFELASEALYMGKRLLVRPLTNQAEQTSNAKALDELKYGKHMSKLSTEAIADWIYGTDRVQVRFPNVAHAIVGQIQAGNTSTDKKWIKSIWDTVEITRTR